ncbi:hypothetical protein PAHAL_4G066800 [Panicum hallii]|uniref:Uncharacterized protein n=1 Tax=Panicum hallii TaxID=206008 RepID=A0A2T8JC19_9POAL|nr:hypothetical protein PAHAL_4G066800 [Panicum hallii]
MATRAVLYHACMPPICHHRRLLPLAAAGDHHTDTRGPWGKNGGDEEGRRGWRRPGSRAAARLGSLLPRGHPSPRSNAPRRIAGPWAGDGAAAAGVGVGDRGGGVRRRVLVGGVAGQRGI